MENYGRANKEFARTGQLRADPSPARKRAVVTTTYPSSAVPVICPVERVTIRLTDCVLPNVHVSPPSG